MITQVIPAKIIDEGKKKNSQNLPKFCTNFPEFCPNSYIGNVTAHGRFTAASAPGSHRILPMVGTFSKIRVSKLHFKAYKNEIVKIHGKEL